MLAIDRRNDIMEQIRQEGSVRVTDLSAKYDVTEETIRRDLESDLAATRSSSLR